MRRERSPLGNQRRVLSSITILGAPLLALGGLICFGAMGHELKWLRVTCSTWGSCFSSSNASRFEGAETRQAIPCQRWLYGAYIFLTKRPAMGSHWCWLLDHREGEMYGAHTCLSWVSCVGRLPMSTMRRAGRTIGSHIPAQALQTC